MGTWLAAKGLGNWERPAWAAFISKTSGIGQRSSRTWSKFGPIGWTGGSTGDRQTPDLKPHHLVYSSELELGAWGWGLSTLKPSVVHQFLASPPPSGMLMGKALDLSVSQLPRPRGAVSMYMPSTWRTQAPSTCGVTIEPHYYDSPAKSRLQPEVPRPGALCFASSFSSFTSHCHYWWDMGIPSQTIFTG